jgi:hypothetical protein
MPTDSTIGLAETILTIMKIACNYIITWHCTYNCLWSVVAVFLFINCISNINISNKPCQCRGTDYCVDNSVSFSFVCLMVFNATFNNISAISWHSLWIRISIRERCTTFRDKVCQWLAPGRRFSPGPSVSSTNTTKSHDVTEILLINVFTTHKSWQTLNIIAYTGMVGTFIFWQEKVDTMAMIPK